MFNERIKELRLSLGMNQVEFAKKLSITKQCVSNWENDNIQPSIEMLAKIAKAFSVSADYLLGFNRRVTLDVSGLSDKEISSLQYIVDSMRNHKE